MQRRRGGRLARWLGTPSVRRRRHRRVAVLGIVLLAAAGLLIVLGGDDGDDDPAFAAEATAVCTEYGDRIQREYELSFPEGAPLTDAAGAEYLSRAFSDTMEELVDRLRDLEPPGDVAAIVDAVAERVTEVRRTPADFLRADPLAGIAERFDEADLAACGSEFLEAPE